MAYKNIQIGGLRLYVNAGRSDFGIGLSFSGNLWKKFVAAIKGKEDDIRPPVDELTTPEVTVTEKTGTPADEIVWYHTIDLGNGVKTPGKFDHTPILERYRLPESFDGKRVLDVATFDGFWAFEFEKRGAREVIALDLDRAADLDLLPRIRDAATEEMLNYKFGKGFSYAAEQLGSKVQRVACSVYDLSPEVHGMFDVVHMGDVLLHLNSPVRALQSLARVCSNYAIISDVYVPELERLGSGCYLEYMGGIVDNTWWQISLKALERMVLDAGFSRIELVNTFRYGGRNMPEVMNHAVIKAYK